MSQTYDTHSRRGPGRWVSSRELALALALALGSRWAKGAARKAAPKLGTGSTWVVAQVLEDFP